jgi:hypothetical protein
MSSKVRVQGERVRAFLLKAIGAGDADVVNAAMKKFGITRQAVNKHIQKMREMGTIAVTGTARKPVYSLAEMERGMFSYPLQPGLAEDVVWTNDVRPILEHLPGNVLNIWHYAFTEMFNNAIDHSGGSTIDVVISKNALNTEIAIHDDGVGIFRKIQGEFDLIDERLAIFELAKGKLTTDPANHTGQGIFFTSRMMDEFSILSGGLMFDHQRSRSDDWLLERTRPGKGTNVWMSLDNHTSRTTRKVFDEYSGGDDYAFNKTVVPLTLAKFGADELVSRSQAKRVLARVNLFATVLFDFKGVEHIGQAFADQIFRVYANEHPEIKLLPINMRKAVQEMVDRARKPGTAPPTVPE